MILAGDIGGTHARLALFEENARQLKLSRQSVYPTREYSSLDEIVRIFTNSEAITIKSACFGIAGPVKLDRASTPNLAWVIDRLELSQRLGIDELWLINDLEAHAYGIDDLQPSDLVTLNEGDSHTGNAGLIAAGTGLGESGLYWDGAHRHPFPCEGGHSDFAPRDELEISLLQYLLKKFDHVSYERVLSGPGLMNIYEFLRDTRRELEPDSLKDELFESDDPPATISRHGVQGTCPICERALDIFVNIYGAEAGNLSLKVLATSGVFVSGGIAGKILPKLRTPAFFQAFIAKGRMRALMETIPVHVVTRDTVGLLGAARYALLKSQH